MYCVKCGVELADSQRSCPLCSTPVYFPGLDPERERPYPKQNKPEVVNARGVHFVITFAFIIVIAVCLLADQALGSSMGWSFYVLGGLALAYIMLILPGWFNRRHPQIFVPCSFGAIALYVGYINYSLDEDWFLTFALPLIGGIALIVSTIAILTHYLRRGHLYIWGGSLVALGGHCILIEWLTVVTFSAPKMFLWSLYPAVTLGLVGIMLIIVAIVKPFRESLRRIFFLG